jgi:two-component system CheB/CheR fusion protein
MQKKIRVTPKKEKIMPAGPQTTSFPIVGIGASAGGLEAYQELLKNLSAKPGMAFVFIMHLTPGHKSLLTELLARLTKMPVREIKNGMPIEVNHVYVKPPGTDLSIASGKLKLNNMKDAGLRRMPIDWFFRSLAEEHGNRAIGVILSGTATDGTLGAEAIKAEGGIVFAQDEESAKYDGMPQSAIAAGCVDFVLSPKKIARELQRIAKHPLISSAGPVKADESIITEDKGIEGIFDILRSTKGLDFTHYKTPTISRRVSRRMVLLKLENLKAYIKFLRENKDEVEELYEDLLLNVTSFFRDPKVFDALKKQVLPAILKSKKKNQDVRIWVPGCSSGEEAYSIAICLLEVLGNKTRAVSVQIFSTDVREDSINEARRGIYGKNIKNSITPERLKRFFTKTGNSYKVSKQLREMCIFSKQNVFSDPPFSNLDLVSCRNLIIYLQPVLQKKVFHNFHYGLRPGGFLLLGNSESIHGYSNLFKTLDGKQRISVKKYLSVGPELELGRKYYPSKKLEIKGKTGIEKGKETDIESIIERIVLDEYAPCGVLIDGSMKVVQFRGHTGRFLESAAGKPSLDIFKLAREGLLMPLRAAIYKARETKHTVKREAEDFQYSGHRMRVNITVVPVKYGPLKEEFFLVLFDEITGAVGLKNLPKARGKISLKGKSVKSDEYIDNLQKELAEAKEYLQTVIEEQESANEEVKTANEEILSSNEELQSTNEELETAKEELQSSNEELITTNEELQNRNAEVSLLNNDLINLLSSINMPVVMMGTDLVIRRITPQCERVLNVISSDVGRPISRIKLNVDIPYFEKILLDVIESLHPKTFEIKDREGNWYSVYIRPYRTLDNKIDGVVAIFVDTTERKKAQQIIEEARIYAENIIETMREPLIVLDTDLKVISANRSFYKTFKVNHKETQGRFIYDLGNRQWDIPKLRQLLEEILPKNNTFDDYEIEHDFETVGPKTMLFNARRLATMQMILITIEDITERKRAEEELRRTYEELQAAHRRLEESQAQLIQTEKMSALGTLVAGTAHELNNPIMGILNFVAHCVKHTSEDAPTYTVLQDIQHEAKRCAEIVRNLLTFSHVKRDDNEAYQKGSLTEILGQVLRLLCYRIEKQGVSVTQHIADDTPEIWMNPNNVQRLILNLIANALDALEDSPIRELNVEIRREGEFIQMTIADTGCGIAAEHLGSIFDPFFTTKPVGQGTGLGLSVCQGIVETHGGKITCESEPGVGAKFTILLPVEKAGKEQIKCASAYL